MREYKGIVSDFAQRTRKRVFIEILSIALLGIFFGSSWSGDIPGWLEISVISISVIYVLLGLALYPRAKSVADNFSVYLSNDSLGFSDKGEIKQLPYCDLVISKVLREHGDVVEIRLRTTFRQTIKLRGLEGMQELYSQLAQKIKGAK
ncbi:MAG: hypothetical protein COB30_010090 [Ectothiorhodospiraceae bacterium]|nr:hypothetical protein [Ectothiorhodospiraceae bacterium]